MLLKVGHRGAMGYEPENTLLSFRKALELGVDMVELDVQVCKTGELVVIHDDTVDRTTDGKGYVAEKTLDELRTLDAGKGERIPVLAEVIDLINGRVKMNIELKGKNTAEPVADLIKKYVVPKIRDRGNLALHKKWEYSDFFISSFLMAEVKKFKELCPEVEIGLLTKDVPKGFLDFAEKLNAYSVNVSSDFINSKIIEEAHQKGLKIYVWKVNDVEDIERVKRMGTDLICSNFPDKI